MARVFFNTALLFLLILPLGAAIYQWAAWAPQGPEGDLLSWSGAEAKRQAAMALNASVRLRGFKAQVHNVKMGENYWGIAQKFGVDVPTVCAFNPELDGLKARLGRPLLLANRRGAIHQVREGETLSGLAQLYAVTPDAIADANELGFFGPGPGQLIFIPKGRPKRMSPGLEAAFSRRRLFSSPLSGGLSSTMGTRSDPFTGAISHHNGIDIKAEYGALVGAAAAGTVIFAGWNSGFGKCIKLDHANGFVTLYGHLNSIKVSLGARVRRHQPIGMVGSTGRATGPHLHFTIFSRGKPVNPLDFLW